MDNRARDPRLPRLPARSDHPGAGRAARLRRQPAGQGSAPGRGRAARRREHRLLRPDGTRQPRRRLRSVLDGVANALQLDDAEREHLRSPRPRRWTHHVASAPAQPDHGAPGHPAGSRRHHRSPGLGTQRPPRHPRPEPHGPRPVLAGPGLSRRRRDQPNAPPTPPGSSTSTRLPASSSSTSTAWPPTPPPCFASKPDATRTTRTSSPWSANSPPNRELFRQHWASHNVKFHRSGRKRLRHPAVGELDLNFEAMELPSDPTLRLNIYTADPDTPTADGLKLLATWAATRAVDSPHTQDARSP